MEDSLNCPDDDMESVMGMDKVDDADNGQHGILKTIEAWASPTLEYIELIFQVAIRIPDYQLQSFLRNRPGLRTLKEEQENGSRQKVIVTLISFLNNNRVNIGIIIRVIKIIDTEPLSDLNGKGTRKRNRNNRR
ncbi:hypothetical protein BGZ51_002957 [Haplosporangium sp. Z 767]|nr:hypothetical protein BGZ51_002957 [Haplosporangium sp. Z 767]KAF9196888.1 hypothetical protein BGZ50_005963 [Haplosporangium sp. Z 11]